MPLKHWLLILYIITLFFFIKDGPYIDLIKGELANWHWLQTRGKIEQSGIAIVKQCTPRGKNSYAIELVEQNDEFSVKYEPYENGGRICLDEEKVYYILKEIPLNTAIPISWVTKKSGEPILMSINGQRDIDNNSSDSIIFPLLFTVGLFVVPIGFIVTGFLLLGLVWAIFGKTE